MNNNFCKLLYYACRITGAFLLSLVINACTNNHSDGSTNGMYDDNQYNQQDTSTPTYNNQNFDMDRYLEEQRVRTQYQSNQTDQNDSFTPDDAYDEGYENGHEQGLEDGKNGHSHGYGYDDSNDYYDYYETRYVEGYEEGYDEGYSAGQSEYEENKKNDENDE